MLERLQILQKHLFAFGFVVLMLVVPTAYALWQLENTKKQVDKIHHNWLPSVALITNINMMTSDFRIEQLQHAATTSEQEMRFCEERMNTLGTKIQENQTAYKKLIVYDEEKELFERFERFWQGYLLLNQEFLKLSGENKQEEASKILDKDSWKLFQEFSEILNELVRINEQGSLLATQNAEETLLTTYKWTGVWVFISLLFSMLMIFWLVRNIVVPVRILEKNANELSNGNFSLPKLNIQRYDEIGSLAHSFEKMAEKIQESNRFAQMQKNFYEQIHFDSAPPLLAEQLFQFLEKHLPLVAGTFYELLDNQLVLQKKYAVLQPVQVFPMGEGLVGQVGEKGNFLFVQIPENPKTAAGSIGIFPISELFIFAFRQNQALKGVFEIGVSCPFSPTEKQFLEYMAQRMGN